MTSKALVSALLSTVTALAGDHMNVSICNLGRVPDTVVARAETVVEAIFAPLQVELQWSDCSGHGISKVSLPAAEIIFRLLSDKPAGNAPSDSAFLMGMAFTAAGMEGDRADAYYGAIKVFAQSHHANVAVVLGYVVAHEIGHLLLGPGHVEGTVMSAKWDAKELSAERRRWLTFNRPQRAAIHADLQARTMLAASQASRAD
jgi:hypothetical protein